MKKHSIVLTMPALALVFGLAFAGCDNEAPDNGGDPLPTHVYGCVFSETANTNAPSRNGVHFFAINSLC